MTWSRCGGQRPGGSWRNPDLRLVTQLRRRYPPQLVIDALAQQELRARAGTKFSRAADMFFTHAGCSSIPLAGPAPVASGWATANRRWSGASICTGRSAGWGSRLCPGCPTRSCRPGWEMEFVAVDRDLKETAVWSPVLATGRTRATILPAGHTPGSCPRRTQAPLGRRRRRASRGRAGTSAARVMCSTAVTSRWASTSHAANCVTALLYGTGERWGRGSARRPAVRSTAQPGPRRPRWPDPAEPCPHHSGDRPVRRSWIDAWW